ncbi:aquIMA [Symbiodinium microadriaticum]|nr:aquIMA [Symbiodinium microadriaticum]CAE7244140.1 aquIMA [Symbiodinium sp. KB8]
MLLGDPALCGLESGVSFDIVVSHVSGSIFKSLWHGDLFSCQGLGPGTWTLYGFILHSVERNVGYLKGTEESRAFRRPEYSAASFRTLVEVCSGIGGFSVGANFLGFETLLCVDKAEIACETVRLNGGNALHGDIGSRSVQLHIAEVCKNQGHILAAGFPCNSYSVQGMGRGLQDPRGQVLLHILQVAWHNQSHGIMLECVAEVQKHQEVIDLLQQFASRMHFHLLGPSLGIGQSYLMSLMNGQSGPWNRHPPLFTVGDLPCKPAHVVAVHKVSPRFLHAGEVGFLNSLPASFQHLADPRAALCLVGQLAAPLQVVWILAQVRDWTELVFDLPRSTDPGALLEAFKRMLLESRKDFWNVPSLGQPSSVWLGDGDSCFEVRIPGPTQVQHFLQAEKSLQGPGCRIYIMDGARRLPPRAFLHPGNATCPYTLVIQDKVARKAAPGPQVSASSAAGTTDVTIWAGLLRLQAATARPAFVVPPGIVARWLCMSWLHSETTTDLNFQWPAFCQTCLLPFVSEGHWSLLVLERPESANLKASLFDGIPGRSTEVAQNLTSLICAACHLSVVEIVTPSLPVQQDCDQCGPMLLAFAALVLGLDAPFEKLLADAVSFCRFMPPHTSSSCAKGGLSEAQQATLGKLLTEHGVPESAVADRVQGAVQKIGAGVLAKALVADNPWQALKAAGSTPNAMFRWVRPEELKAHAQARAQLAFGTAVGNAKARKQKPAKTTRPVLNVDPATLQLASGSFVSTEGNPLSQLAFDEVGPQACGIAFCSAQQMLPFVSDYRALSVDALALVSTAPLPVEACSGAPAANIRFPAVYSPTQEAVLLSGTILQLGDEHVQLSPADSAMGEVDQLDTIVGRVSLFRDEAQLDWDVFVKSPVKCLLQHVQGLNLCRDTGCKGDCAAFHPAVEEHVDRMILDVWARQFARLEGGKTNPETAELFQALIRVPSSAAKHLQHVHVAGFYFEPRAANGFGPHPSYAVVWLPGHDKAQASHLLRTCDKAIGLARLGSKYGLRVLDEHEQAVFEALRPQQTFVKVKVLSKWRLHPLPHGMQRHALVQLLGKWKWAAKPLQPCKGDSSGCAWEVGSAVDPPASIMQAGEAFVLIHKIRDVGQPSKPEALCASSRTRRRILYDDPDVPQSSTDPWSGGRDPWSQARLPPGLPAPAVPVATGAAQPSAAVSKLTQVKSELQAGLATLVRKEVHAVTSSAATPNTAQDDRIQKLEVGLNEVRMQNNKFEEWFQTFGTQMRQQAEQVLEVQQTVKSQQSELGNLRSEVTSSIAQVTPAANSGHVAVSACAHFPFCRFGEATNPGPGPLIFVGTSNPSGLRNKEQLIADLGPGVWQFSETQLSAVTLPVSSRGVKALTRAQHRDVRIFAGAPAPLRPGSHFAGSWTGVLTMSDFPCRPVQLQWLHDSFHTGRVQALHHFVNDTPILTANVYGYPSGKTFIDARARTERLLETLTHELVLGRKGIRIISGDFNHWHAQLDQVTIWKQQGFENSLNGYVTAAPAGQLPHRCYGRASRLSPDTPAQVFPPKPARPGDEAIHHDLLSLEVKRWYQQLRRLQSLDHAMQAGSQSHNAVEHRLGLWRSILGARGFRPGFQHWWLSRPVQLAGSPRDFPALLPCAAVCHLLFLDFRDNYRKFEAWNIRQRRAILAEQYAHNHNLLFRDLRDPKPEQVDTLELKRSYCVLAVDPPTCSVHLDSKIETRGCSQWQLDGCTVQVKVVAEDVCSITDCPALHADAELEQTVVLSSASDVQSEFENLWSQFWQRHADPTQVDWSRVTAFAEAYLPRGQLSLPPISLEQWRGALRRFKPQAARGPDGFARLDLLNMSDAHASQLLDFLTDIESGVRSWPEQWLVSLICCLKKPNDKQGSNGYRPICLLSCAYRAWSGLRARQVLRWLVDLMPDSALGFMPGREAAQFWYVLEAQIELACQYDLPFLGYSADVVKAFNCLPRWPVIQIALHIGLPASLVQPWTSFLDGLERRFLIRNAVGQPLRSTCGFPEGCALSTVAMSLVCLCFHAYMDAFSSGAVAQSYVDNLACTASTVGQLTAGVNVSRTFLDMLGLSLDSEKTYTWAVQSSHRAQLSVFGLQVLDHASELGGVISFGRATRNSVLVQRCRNLGPWFDRLRRSPSNLHFKLKALPAKFWSHALHGISGCPLATSVLANLRAQAVRALRMTSAGSSAMLRLSTSGTIEADPGFFELWSTLRDLRRLAAKSPLILPLWMDFMSNFQGNLQHGPFSKLLQVLGRVGWSIGTPPCIFDHTGIQHDLLHMPRALLRLLCEEAWLHHVATHHRHRSTMHDLNGLDRSLLHADMSRLGPLDQSRVAALRSGAFMFDACHARYDNSLDPTLALASWSSVNANTGLIVACGPVPGILQSAPRAELWGAIASLKWGVYHDAPVTLWTDSDMVGRGLRKLVGGITLTPADNADLWQTLEELVRLYPEGHLVIQHVPSHVDSNQSRSPFEDWVIEWNHHADTLAVLANMNRPLDLRRVHEQAIGWHNYMLEASRALRGLYMGIANATLPNRNRDALEHDTDENVPSLQPPTEAFVEDFADSLPIAWRQVVVSACPDLPPGYVLALADFLLTQAQASAPWRAVSWLEFVFMLHERGVPQFPVRSLSSDTWQSSEHVPLGAPALTVAVQLGLVRKAMRRIFKALQRDDLLIDFISLSDFGVSFSVSGVRFAVDASLLQAARRRLLQFCAGRKISTVGDLARFA